MDYTLEFRKFLSSQYLFTGIRVTAGVIIPAVILYQYGMLAEMIAIPLGALFTSLADNPGPPQYRRNGMLASIGFNLLVMIVARLSGGIEWLLILEIILFGLFFSLIGIFGNRANSVGLLAMIVFILNFDSIHHNQNVFLQAGYYAIGAGWYALLSLLIYKLSPYRPLQQLLGESLIEISNYLQSRARFYDSNQSIQKVYTQLFETQVRIHRHHEELREMLFSTRMSVAESTQKGRVLMMIFLESVDLLERIMTAQQNYSELHHQFGQYTILPSISAHIRRLAAELEQIGLAIQEGHAVHLDTDPDEDMKKIMDEFFELRKLALKSSNVERFITLRHILYSLQDLTDRIKRLRVYTGMDKQLSRELESSSELRRFSPQKEIEVQQLIDNISLRSSTFRHGLRLTIALLTGYLVSLFIPVGHGYWILLTIATIMRPAFSLTKQRNIQRVAGTLIGTGIGFLLLYFEPNDTAIFIVMVVSMIISYSFLKVNYGLSTFGLTIFLLLSFHFLTPTLLSNVLLDRLVDTAIGSIIAYVIPLMILPNWEHEQIDRLVREALESNKKYFDSIAHSFAGTPSPAYEYKLERKTAFVALANLTDNLQRMLSEPKNRQRAFQDYHQFASTSHMLTSHIAALAYYAERFAKDYADSDFSPMIRIIDNKFQRILIGDSGTEAPSPEWPLNKRVEKLLEMRRRDLSTGSIDSTPMDIRKETSNLKTITDQFKLIFGTLIEVEKIWGNLKKDSDLKNPARNGAKTQNEQ